MNPPRLLRPRPGCGARSHRERGAVAKRSLAILASVAALLAGCALVIAAALAENRGGVGSEQGDEIGADASTGLSRSERAAAADAFLEIVRVLKSPRCVNCHPAGDSPLQDDEGRPHDMLVVRGPDGNGLPAMRCSACHGRRNFPAEDTPPGAPTWHLPPPETPMVFEGRSAAEICRLMKDPEQNGHKTHAELVHHMTADSLVLWGWNPGPGRTLPPLSQPEFARAVHEWEKGGFACPDDGEVADAP